MEHHHHQLQQQQGNLLDGHSHRQPDNLQHNNNYSRHPQLDCCNGNDCNSNSDTNDLIRNSSNDPCVMTRYVLHPDDDAVINDIDETLEGLDTSVENRSNYIRQGNERLTISDQRNHLRHRDTVIGGDLDDDDGDDIEDEDDDDEDSNDDIINDHLHKVGDDDDDGIDSVTDKVIRGRSIERDVHECSEQHRNHIIINQDHSETITKNVIVTAEEGANNIICSSNNNDNILNAAAVNIISNKSSNNNNNTCNNNNNSSEDGGEESSSLSSHHQVRHYHYYNIHHNIGSNRNPNSNSIVSDRHLLIL